MFLAKSITESQERQKRQERTQLDLASCHTLDEKLALIYSDFSIWGTRIERDVSTIKKAAIWIAVLLTLLVLKACDK